MAVQSIGGVSAASSPAPTGATAPAGSSSQAASASKDSTAKESTIVIAKVTKTNPDGSTTTTITYADGHTKVETTPAKFSATDSQGAGRVTAVDILA